MNAEDIAVGHCYRAKRPKRAGGFGDLIDDRQVKWISAGGTQVQYDGPAVAMGRKYPTVSMEKFLKWASHDVTELLPNGEWAAWASFEETTK